MKIRLARFYQSISIFNGQTYKAAITYLDVTKPQLIGDLEMTIEPGIGLRIETEHDTVLVTFNNIASMHVLTEEKKAKPAPKSGKSA